MQTIATTKMSSKGQVVIPEQIRKLLSLKSGTQFLVLGEGDVVVLKTIAPPSAEEFDMVIRRAREQAIRAGMVPDDVSEAIRQSRQEK
ncbi:MAG: AbrB/MazE/SpoVT family DNA-binding domain-containing protein [Lentisphaeria bacterium]|jgi:AbrB family looped-hinge helix DNA binding protein|nr:AbrB/MazE/SpoVT family DNA-binding domain-containing protein [Lentisphaeria bacterium]